MVSVSYLVQTGKLVPGVDVIKVLFFRKSRFPQNEEIEKSLCTKM